MPDDHTNATTSNAVARGDRPAITTRQRILAAALELVREYGVRGLTIRGIAMHCAVGPAEIYRHFPSRGAVLEGLRREGGRLLEIWLSAPEAGGGRAGDLDDLCRGYLEFARQRGWLYRIVFGAARLDDANPARSMFTSLVERRLAQGAESGRHAERIWLALHGYASVIAEESTNCDDPERAVALSPSFLTQYVRWVVSSVDAR